MRFWEAQIRQPQPLVTTTQDDANNSVNAISNIFTVDSSLSEVFFRADFVGSTCFSTTSLVINTGAVPVITSPADIFECSATGSTTIDLTQVETELLNGLDPTQHTVTYHATQDDADGNVNLLDTNYATTATSEEIFVRVTHTDGCFSTTSFLVGVTNAPSIPSLAGLTSCDEGSGSATFDLTERDADVLVGLSSTDYVVTYHETQADADAGFPILPANYTSGPGQVYVRLQSLAHLIVSIPVILH